MLRPFTLACAAAIFGMSVAAWADNDDGIVPPPSQEVAREMGYNSLETGTIVYEEVPRQPDSEGNIEDIAPAAGDEEGHVVRFVYDPLTQTFRRTIVDKHGNSIQDVINTNQQ